MGATRRFNATTGLSAASEVELRGVLDQLVKEGHTRPEAVTIAAKSAVAAGTYTADVEKAILRWQRRPNLGSNERPFA
jgi:hypothetical protein